MRPVTFARRLFLSGRGWLGLACACRCRLSAARSPRTIQRYIQLVDKMNDAGTLTGTLQDALRAANFTDDVKGEVLQITGGLSLTDLYVLYDMVGDIPLSPT